MKRIEESAARLEHMTLEELGEEVRAGRITPEHAADLAMGKAEDDLLGLRRAVEEGPPPVRGPRTRVIVTVGLAAVAALALLAWWLVF